MSTGAAALGALLAVALLCTSGCEPRKRTPPQPTGKTSSRGELGLAAVPPRGAGVCSDGQHEPPTRFACSSDDDCCVCHDGSNCGVVVNLVEYGAQGAACRREDAAECEYSVPRCCEGRCVRSSH